MYLCLVYFFISIQQYTLSIDEKGAEIERSCDSIHLRPNIQSNHFDPFKFNPTVV